MADRTPVRVVFNASNVATGLAEFQSGDTVPIASGGTGISSIGSAGQVLLSGGAGASPTWGTTAYDISFIAGYDNVTVKENIIVQTYGEMVMARTGTFEGETGYIDTVTAGSAAIVDILKNGSSIYSTKPQFAAGATALTAGTRSTTSFVSGDRITFKVVQIGSSTAGQGLRFMLKCKV